MARGSKTQKVVSLRPREASPAFNVRTAVVTRWSENEGIIVDYPESPRGPQAVATTIRFSAAELDALVASRDAVLLTFENGDFARPILVGLTQPIPHRRSPAPAGSPEVTRQGTSTGDEPMTALVDGDVVQLRGAERVELRCGKASIVLTKEGKIVLNGTYLSSTSSGAHRLRGASIEIN